MEKIKDLKERFLSWYSDLGKSERKKLLELVVYAVIGLLLFAWFFVGCVDVAKASTLTDTYPTPPTDNTYKNYIVLYSGVRSETYCITFNTGYDNNPVAIFEASDGITYLGALAESKRYRLSDDGGSWEYETTGTNVYYLATGSPTIIASTVDVFDNRNNNALFFQQAPCPTLAAGLTGAQIAQMMTAEWTGLVPLLVGFLVLAISLWRGLGSLYRLLRTA